MRIFKASSFLKGGPGEVCLLGEGHFSEVTNATGEVHARGTKVVMVELAPYSVLEIVSLILARKVKNAVQLVSILVVSRPIASETKVSVLYSAVTL